jgi:hypothetical protein
MTMTVLPDDSGHGSQRLRRPGLPRLTRARVAIAIAAVAALIAGITVVANHHDKKLVWDPRVLPIATFVEHSRGLTFKHPVPVEFLAEKEFEKHVTSTPAEDKKDAKDLEDYVGRLRALALVGGKVDLRKAENDLTGSSIIGLYVPKDKRIFVRGATLSPYVRTTLAHELTHALQDQYYDLTKMRDVPDDTAVTALIEGDAKRIEEAYQETLSAGDKKAYDAQERKGQSSSKQRTSDVPAVLIDGLGFPYVFGPVFLDQLVEDHSLDAAFRHPPTAEAQILDPIGHPFSVKPKSLPAPVLPAGAKTFGKVTPFGQVFLLEVLGSRLSYDQAYRAVSGWTGDTSVGYRVGGVACNAADVRTTSAGVLAAALRTWAAFVPKATVTVSGDTVSVRSCDPGKTAVPGERTPSAFTVLSVRASLIHAFVKQSAPLAVATCTADVVLADYRASGYLMLTKDKLTDAETTTLRAHIVAAVTSCR